MTTTEIIAGEDIELVMVNGAHGPRAMHLIVIAG